MPANDDSALSSPVAAGVADVMPALLCCTTPLVLELAKERALERHGTLSIILIRVSC